MFPYFFYKQRRCTTAGLMLSQRLQHAAKRNDVCFFVCVFFRGGGGTHIGVCKAGVLVQWLKLSAWKVGNRGLEPRSGIQVSKKQNVSSPLTGEDSISWGTSVTEK